MNSNEEIIHLCDRIMAICNRVNKRLDVMAEQQHAYHEQSSDWPVASAVPQPPYSHPPLVDAGFHPPHAQPPDPPDWQPPYQPYNWGVNADLTLRTSFPQPPQTDPIYTKLDHPLAAVTEVESHMGAIDQIFWNPSPPQPSYYQPSFHQSERYPPPPPSSLDNYNQWTIPQLTETGREQEIPPCSPHDYNSPPRSPYAYDVGPHPSSLYDQRPALALPYRALQSDHHLDWQSSAPPQSLRYVQPSPAREPFAHPEYAAANGQSSGCPPEPLDQINDKFDCPLEAFNRTESQLDETNHGVRLPTPPDVRYNSIGSFVNDNGESVISPHHIHYNYINTKSTSRGVESLEGSLTLSNIEASKEIIVIDMGFGRNEYNTKWYYVGPIGNQSKAVGTSGHCSTVLDADARLIPPRNNTQCLGSIWRDSGQFSEFHFVKMWEHDVRIVTRVPGYTMEHEVLVKRPEEKIIRLSPFAIQLSTNAPPRRWVTELAEVVKLCWQLTYQRMRIDDHQELHDALVPQSAALFYLGPLLLTGVIVSYASIHKLKANPKAKKDVNFGVPGKFLHAVKGMVGADVGSMTIKGKQFVGRRLFEINKVTLRRTTERLLTYWLPP